MRGFALAFAILACGGLLAFGITQEAPRGRVQGTVVMSETGRPLPKARVLLVRTDVDESKLDEDDRDDLSIRSDEHGRFNFSSISAGQYTLEVSARAHSANKITINVSEGQAYATEIKTYPNPDSLNAYFSQQNWLPDETPKFELTGFTPKNKVKMELYRFEPKSVAGGLSRNEILFGQNANRTWPNPNTTKVRDWVYEPVNRDVEGRFVDQVKLDGLKEGMYAVEVSSGAQVQRGFVNVTRLAMVTRSDKDRVVCYVADLSSGKPVSGAEIFGSVDHQRSLLGHSDGQGLFIVADNKVNRTLTAVSGASTALLDTTPNEGAGKGSIAFVTDRPIYRPGDMVQFKGIVRLLKGSEYVLPAPGKAEVKVHDQNGTLITSVMADIDPHGCFHGSWTSSSESKPGYYGVEISACGVTVSRGISLAAYRKPEFSIDVRSTQKRYILGDTGDVTIAATYYYGAPVVGAKVQVSLYRSPKWDVVAPWDDAYDSSGDEGGFGEYLENRDVVTDEKGEAHLRVPLTAKNPNQGKGRSAQDDSDVTGQDYTYQVEAYVSDASGKGFSGRGSFDVAQGDYRVFAQTSQYVTEKGKPVSLDIATVGLDDNTSFVSDRPIQIKVLKERYSDGEVTTEPIGNLETQTDAKGQAHVSVPIDKRGSIRLSVTSQDAHGRTVGTIVYIYSESPGEGAQDDEGTRFAISLDKKSYKVGDVAKVLIQGADAVGAGALVCADGESILSQKVVPLTSSSATVEIPVTEAMAPNGFVSVIAVKNKKLLEATRKVSLDWTSRDLKIELATDAAKYKPGATVQVSVKTSDRDGKPVAASLSLGCVDESIYAIRKDSLKIKNEFYPMRFDSVRTQHSFEEVYLDGGDKSTVHLAIRKNFRDTAAWLPDLNTGSDGKGQTTVTLPDNLTSWRLTAVGITDRSDVGQTTLNFRTWKPLMVRLDCPTFLVKDDHQQLTIGITNDTDKDADVKVQLSATSGKLEGLDGTPKHIAAGKQLDVPVTFTATETGSTKVVASAIAGDSNDAIEKTFPVVPRGMMDIEGHSGEVGANTEATFKLQPGADPRFGDLRVRLESSVAASALGAIDQLIDYPYGCVEQTIDRFVPSLIVAKLVEDLHLPAPARLKEVPKIAKDSLTRLAAMQHADGGWGWWTYDASNPMMTCLVLDGLSRSSSLGYTTNQIREKDALGWLAKLAATDISTPTQKELKGYEWLAIAATLAERGDAASAKKALAHFDRQLAGPAEWSFAARAFHALGDSAHTQEALVALHKTVQSQYGGSHWLAQGWTDQETNTGFALEALAKIDPKDSLIPKVVRYLMYHRANGGWSTTLATAKVLSAMDAYLRATGQTIASGEVQVVINGNLIQTARLGVSDPEASVVIPRSALKEGENTLSLRRNGQGVGYFTASLRQFGAQPATAAVSEDPGLSVERAYRLLRPGRNEKGVLDLIPSTLPIESAQSGDVIQCEIKIKNNTPREFMFLEDPIPSNCHVTEQTDLEEGTEWSYWYSGMQVLDDRVGVFARDLPAGSSTIVYHMRAESPGVSHALPTHLNGMYNPGKGSFSTEGPMEVR